MQLRFIRLFQGYTKPETEGFRHLGHNIGRNSETCHDSIKDVLVGKFLGLLQGVPQDSFMCFRVI